MSLKRNGGSSAFYVNCRVGGRVVSTYAGSGPVALILAGQAEARREAEANRRAAWEAERDSILAGDRAVDEAGAAIGRAVRLILEAAGFHRIKRGPWRRRRKGDGAVGNELDAATMMRAQEGDESSGLAIREAFASDRGFAAIMADSPHGDRALANRDAAIKGFCGKNLLAQASIGAKVDALRAELAGPKPTAIERLLADRAAMDWLTLHLAEGRERHCDERRADSRELEFHRRRVESRHRRYLASLKALAAVRRIDLTAVQLNLYGAEPAPGPGPDPRGPVLDVTAPGHDGPADAIR